MHALWHATEKRVEIEFCRERVCPVAPFFEKKRRNWHSVQMTWKRKRTAYRIPKQEFCGDWRYFSCSWAVRCGSCESDLGLWCWGSAVVPLRCLRVRRAETRHLGRCRHRVCARRTLVQTRVLRFDARNQHAWRSVCCNAILHQNVLAPRPSSLVPQVARDGFSRARAFQHRHWSPGMCCTWKQIVIGVYQGNKNIRKVCCSRRFPLKETRADLCSGDGSNDPGHRNFNFENAKRTRKCFARATSQLRSWEKTQGALCPHQILPTDSLRFRRQTFDPHQTKLNKDTGKVCGFW